jgi:Peptidase family C25/Propeptide_C25
MKKGVKNEVIFSLLLIIILITNIFSYAYAYENKPILQDNETAFFGINKDTITITVSLESCDIKNNEKGQELFVENFGRLPVPGKPNLPSKIFAVAIPPGAEVVNISHDVREVIILPGIYEISPVPLSRMLDREDSLIYGCDKETYGKNLNSTYESNDPYPSSIVEFVRNAYYRRYNLVDIRVTPFAYRPLSGQLTYYPNVVINVSYKFSGQARDEIIDNLVGTERIAEEIIVNYDQAKNWYPNDKILSRGIHDYVIITLDSLISSVSPLVKWETSKGRNVEIATVSWINTSYGGCDLAEKIRNFLRDKYPSSEWGIEDVILVGHYDDVPIRRTWQDIGYGMPETDFYYAELSLPDCQSWDADENHQYGEDSDIIDFYSEVNVGRIPWNEPDIVLGICNKSVAYEQNNNNPSYRKNMLLLGAFFWNDTDNAELMERIADQLQVSDWTMTKMYEKNEDCWSFYDCDYPLLHSNVMSVWSDEKYAFVNWAGHGSVTSAHIFGLEAPSFISSHDCPMLNDNYPAIVFANACSNSDTDYLSIGQTMLKQGAVGFLGPTKASRAAYGWWHPNDGSSQSLNYFFVTYVTSGNYTMAEAHQLALREMYSRGLWHFEEYEMFEWSTLFGNPNLGMNAIGVFPFFEIDGINGGLGITSVIKNTGSADAYDVQCNITINNGYNIITKEASYMIPFLAAGESEEVSMPVFGFGLGMFTHFPTITVTAGASYANTAEVKLTAKIFGPFVILQ